MRFCTGLGFVFLILWCGWASAVGAPENPPGILGFSPGGAEEQRLLESKMDMDLDPAQIGDWIRSLSSRPHHPGSPKGRENAEFMASLFRSWGYETRLDVYRILFPTPKLRLLEMLEPEPFRARLIEPALAEDSTSGQTSEILPAYNAYSPDGEATGQLVYVNYGIPADYEQLERRASRSRTGSSSPATVVPGGGSSPSWQPSGERWPASSIPIRKRTGTFRVTPIPRVRFEMRMGWRGDRCSTCPSIPGIL